MSATAILIRWAKGHVYVGEKGHEVFYNIPGITSKEQAIEIGNKIRTVLKLVKTTTALSGPALHGNQAPGAGGMYPGNKMAGSLITSVTVTLGEDYTTVVPELNDAVTLRLEELDRMVQRAAAGTKSQWSSPTISRQGIGSETDSTPPEFTIDGILSVQRYSPIWKATRHWRCAWLDCNVRKAGWGDTSIMVAKVFDTGAVVPVKTVVIKAGKKRGLARVNHAWAPGEELILAVTRPGGVEALTVSLRGAHI